MRNSNQRCSKPEPSDRNRGLAHVILGNYLWNWSTAFKPSLPEDAWRAANDLAPTLAAELARVDKIDTHPDFPYERNVLEKVLEVGGRVFVPDGEIRLEWLVVRFLIDEVFPQVKHDWEEIIENLHHDANDIEFMLERLCDALSGGKPGDVQAGRLYANWLCEDYHHELNQMADEAVQATEPAPAA